MRSVEEEGDNFSLLRSQIQNLSFGPHTLAIVESLLVSKDAHSLLLIRSRLRDFLRLHSVSALNAVADSLLLHKLSVLDFFIASFALVADVESCLALKYEALVLRELKHAKFPSLQVSFQEWLTFSNGSFDNGFYYMAVKGCENALLRLQPEGDKNSDFSSRLASMSKIKELRDRAQKLAASESVKTRTANYLRNRVVQQNQEPPASASQEEFASSKYRLGIKKRHQKRLEEIKRR